MSAPRLGCFVLSITSSGYWTYMKLKGFSNLLFFYVLINFLSLVLRENLIKQPGNQFE